MNTSKTTDHYMRQALTLAEQALELGEFPSLRSSFWMTGSSPNRQRQSIASGAFWVTPNWSPWKPPTGTDCHSSSGALPGGSPLSSRA